MSRLSEIENFLGGLSSKNPSFIETGCYQGEGLRTASKYFPYLFSCDIHQKYVDHCRALYPQAQISREDSFRFLIYTCATVITPAVFWLDAHFPEQYGTGQKGDQLRFPLYEELNIIKQHRPQYQYDVIICDDLRVVQSEDNPVRGKVGEHNLREEHLVTDRKFQDYVGVFEDTHSYQLFGLDGLVLFPRSGY